MKHYKTRSGTNDLDEMCIILWTNLPHDITKTTGQSLLVELRRCVNDSVTLLDKDLHAVAYGNDKDIEEHDLEKLGKRLWRKINVI